MNVALTVHNFSLYTTFPFTYIFAPGLSNSIFRTTEPVLQKLEISGSKYSPALVLSVYSQGSYLNVLEAQVQLHSLVYMS